METLVTALVLVGLAALLAVPYRFPRIGLGMGALLAVAGVSIYCDRHEDAYFREMFVQISHSIGTAVMIYASMWLLVAATRFWAKRPAVAV